MTRSVNKLFRIAWNYITTLRSSLKFSCQLKFDWNIEHRDFHKSS